MTIHTAPRMLSEEASQITKRAAVLATASPDPQGADGVDRFSSVHLAHYTSLQAMISMLQTPSGGLRLSDSNTMNDPEEGESTSDGRLLLHLINEVGTTAPWIRERYGSAYICCFVGIVEKGKRTINPGDDLLFWRLYGNECRGVSITMAPHVSQPLLQSGHVREVTYTDEPPMQSDAASISALLRDLDQFRTRALAAGLWADVREHVLPACDRFLAERFLQKRPHYKMEGEYRAIMFDTGDSATVHEGTQIASRGVHVQYGCCRNYVQVRELSCRKMFSTDSQITIGSNVREAAEVQGRFVDLLRSTLDLAPGVVRIRVSGIPYRPR